MPRRLQWSEEPWRRLHDGGRRRQAPTKSEASATCLEMTPTVGLKSTLICELIRRVNNDKRVLYIPQEVSAALARQGNCCSLVGIVSS